MTCVRNPIKKEPRCWTFPINVLLVYGNILCYLDFSMSSNFLLSDTIFFFFSSHSQMRNTFHPRASNIAVIA